MPTGYTAGILDGDIKTFPEFAKLCMKAFGACIHMRDDNMYAEYKPVIPSDYHKKELTKAKRELKRIKELSDDELISKQKKILTEALAHLLKYIKEKEKNKIILDTFYNDIIKWQPPTDEHINFKNFMLKQIKDTISYDCNTDYNEREILSIQNKINNLNVFDLRNDEIKNCLKDINYHKEEYKKEVNSCKTANKWVEDLLKSLNNENNG